MTVSLGLILIGPDGKPPWACRMQARRQWHPETRDCCEAGHPAPEEAAGHGAAIAAIYLATCVRALEPPAIGALALTPERKDPS